VSTRGAHYPLKINVSSIENPSGQFEFKTKIDLGLEENIRKVISHPGVEKSPKSFQSRTRNHLRGSGYFGNIRPGVAETRQSLSYTSSNRYYGREIYAYNRSILYDKISQ
jgi:hypothetical protein